MRIGVFGGSFDPVHLGHLLLAEQCLEAAGLDQIRFIPADVPPHKQDWVLSPAKDRLQMLRLAIGGNERFEVEACEIDRGGISYTVDTLEQLTARQPGAELFLLMGADSLDEFHTWKDPARICQLALPLVVERPGFEPVDLAKLSAFADEQKLAAIRSVSFASRRIDLSSTEIRERVAMQQSIRYQTPRAVEQFIAENGLYRSGE